MPFIGWIIGDIDLNALNIVLAKAVTDANGAVVKPEVVIGIGTFISTVIDFVLIAFIVFLVIKLMAKAKEIAEKNKKKEKIF